MISLIENGVFVDKDLNIINDEAYSDKKASKKNTMAYRILQSHNTSDSDTNLKIKFDKLTSHDITFVGIIQTARASGLEEFPVPYVLTNCHNSLCAVGGTINEDDHMFGLSAAKKYGGIYVPPHQAVIHQFAREMFAECGKMILGSDSHTRYGALGTMGIGEGGPELVKQLLSKTYDIKMPEVVGVYLKGKPRHGVGPQDIALAIIGSVFDKGFVNNKVMEFIGPGISNLSVDTRIGIDVMTTETTCLSSIWATDEKVEEYYSLHNRKDSYHKIGIEETAYYDSLIIVELDKIKPMIAMPFHPSKVYTIEELIQNPKDILSEIETSAKNLLGDNIDYKLTDKIVNGNIKVEQGIIAGCAGGGFENIVEARDILLSNNIGYDKFNLSVYPASMPIYYELASNGVLADITKSGAVVKTAFCGPCFGAGDTPSNNALSIRHTTRNFPNREGSKPKENQIASVALMDARSIAATAANKGILTPADSIDYKKSNIKYNFNEEIYKGRVYNGFGKADKKEELVMGPNIKDWPEMTKLPKHMLLKVVSYITDPVTTTDELIPSGETSSFRSNPLRLAEFALSRKDPNYVAKAKQVKNNYDKLLCDKTFDVLDSDTKKAIDIISKKYDISPCDIGIGSTIYAVKPGDGSAREQAASCQKVLGGWANIANSYATKRYRSNLINWGMIPFEIDDKPQFGLDDYIFIPNIRDSIINEDLVIRAYNASSNSEFDLKIKDLTDAERKIILDGCLINYYKNN